MAKAALKLFIMTLLNLKKLEMPAKRTVAGMKGYGHAQHIPKAWREGRRRSLRTFTGGTQHISVGKRSVSSPTGFSQDLRKRTGGDGKPTLFAMRKEIMKNAL